MTSMTNAREKGIRWLSILGFTCLCLTAAAQVPTRAEILQRLSAREVRQLEKGKIVLFMEDDASGHTWVRAALLFDNSLEETWRILNSTEDQPKYLKNLREVRVVSESHLQNIAYFHIKWLFIDIEIQLVHDFLPDEHYVHWHLDPAFASDMEVQTGYWKLYPYGDGRTLGEYANNISLGGLPEWLENLVKKSVVRGTLSDLQEFVAEQAQAGSG